MIGVTQQLSRAEQRTITLIIVALVDAYNYIQLSLNVKSECAALRPFRASVHDGGVPSLSTNATAPVEQVNRYQRPCIKSELA